MPTYSQLCWLTFEVKDGARYGPEAIKNVLIDAAEDAARAAHPEVETVTLAPESDLEEV